MTNNASWRYCPSSDNPADLLTRGIQAQTLASFQLWKNGPAWLTQETNWPRWEPNSVLLQVSDPATSQQRNLQTPDDQPQPTPPKVTGITEMIDHTKFSRLQKLVRTTAWVMRLVNMARKREVNKGKSLTPKEIHAATHVWIRGMQRKVYHNEFVNLQQKNAPRLPLVRQLRPFILEDHIIRCGGRIEFTTHLWSFRQNSRSCFQRMNISHL